MRVYHFLSANNALSDIIFRRLRVSRYADLNDPFELSALNVGDEVFRRVIEASKAQFNSRVGLMCFCRDIKSPLLWSHYADKHRGICLGFDIPDGDARPIKYSKNRIVIKFIDNVPSKGMTEASTLALLGTKYEQWKYEDEVRVEVPLELLTQEAGSFFAPFGKGLTLREVIVGAVCELPLHWFHDILGKCYGEEVELSKAAQAFRWFEMVKQKVEVEKS